MFREWVLTTVEQSSRVQTEVARASKMSNSSQDSLAMTDFLPKKTQLQVSIAGTPFPKPPHSRFPTFWRALTKVDGLSHCSRLLRISLEANKLAGTLPDAVGSWKSLRKLEVRHNRFAGALPGAVASWRSMRGIQLCNNKLSGVA